MKNKILIITPIEHLKNVKDILLSISNSEIVFLPNCKINDIDKHKDSFAIFTNPNKSNIYLGRKTLSSFKKLKIICTASTGTIHIDKSFCSDNKIEIISLTEERNIINKIPSTAEHAFALMLSSIRNIPKAIQSVKNDLWNYEPYIGRQIKSLRVGVIGYGRLGTFFANYCDAFGANVIVYDPYKSVIHPRIKQTDNMTFLAKTTEIISLHVHVTKETQGMINSSFLNHCNKSLHLINTSRGEIVNENDLVNFLNNNKKSKYATDVLSEEINGIKNNPIKKYFETNQEQVIITPHIGGMTEEAQNMAYEHAANLLKNAISHSRS